MYRALVGGGRCRQLMQGGDSSAAPGPRAPGSERDARGARDRPCTPGGRRLPPHQGSGSERDGQGVRGVARSFSGGPLIPPPRAGRLLRRCNKPVKVFGDPLARAIPSMCIPTLLGPRGSKLSKGHKSFRLIVRSCTGLARLAAGIEPAPGFWRNDCVRIFWQVRQVRLLYRHRKEISH